MPLILAASVLQPAAVDRFGVARLYPDAPDGVAVLGALAEVPRTDWKVVAEIPAATAYADIRRLRNTTVLLVLVLLLVVGSLAYGLGLLIVLPLERLSRAANRVAGQRLHLLAGQHSRPTTKSILRLSVV